MCPADLGDRSQPRVEKVVEVASQLTRIDRREVSAPGNQLGRGRRWTRSGPESGYLDTVPGDGDQLASSDPVEDVASVVTEVTHTD